MSKPWMNTIVVLVLLVSFVLVTNKLTKLNEHDLHEVRNWEDVKSWQYEQTPGLLRAEELGLAKNYDITIPIEGTSKTFELNEIWYNKNTVYIFYSVDYEKNHIPTINFHFGTEVVDSRNYVNRPYSGNVSPDEGVVYKGRYYHRVQVNPIYNEEQEFVEEVEQAFLKEFTVRIDEKTYELEPITVQLDYQLSNEEEVEFALDKEQVVKGHTITWKSMFIGTSHNALGFSFEPLSSYVLSGVQARVETDHGEERTIYTMNSLGDKHYSLSFDPFNVYPTAITIKTENIHLTDDQRFSFEFNVEDFTIETTDKKVHTLLETIQETDIFLERLFYDDRGVMFELLLKPTPTNDGNQYLVATTPTVYGEYEHRLGEAKTPKEEERLKAIPYIMHVTNEKGEIASYGSRGSGPEERMGLFLDRAFIEKSKTIRVEVSHLLHEIKVHENVEFEIGK
ncbi:hypothetical protein ACFSCX_16565 [Bacillus salitolerans]|uniref:DUF4179 domain-containing protein n=1 Tax=Bacillus salitolerans TaxID=1437434 RepID=A0ABW4LST8_9BACI